MANLSVSLSNLLKNLNYHYAMASKQNAESQSKISTSANSANASNLSKNNNLLGGLKLFSFANTIKPSASNSTSLNINTTSASNTSLSSKITFSTTTNNNSLSGLSKLLGNISKTTSKLNNITVITNDTVTEFFKSYKNANMTTIYNKIQNGSAMSETDLANFKSQVAKLSTDEQKLWKSEITKIEGQISSKISAQTKVNTNNNTNSKSSSNSGSNLTNKTTSQNGFVSGVLYQNGSKFTGVYTDGKYYSNGVLATATVNGKYYYNGVLANGTINGKTYENGVVKTTTTTTTTSETSSKTTAKDLTVASRKTDSNGNILGYNASGKLVYLEKNVNGKKVTYTDELTYLNTKTLNYLKSVDDAVLTDRVLADIQIVKNAEKAGLKAGTEGSSAYKKAYDEAIKYQMIKTTSNMTGAAGEVVEKNGALYVNDGNGLVKLNISANTYLNLFPPVDRYDINQNSIGDCYFVSGCLTDMMKNDKTRAQLLQMFSEDSNGNITVKFAGSLKNYPVTFENGQLKAVDGKVNGASVSRKTLASGSLGTQMLEEAYAIACFSSEKGKSVNSVDIDETFDVIKSGVQNNVYNEVLGIQAKRDYSAASNIASYLDSMASKVNNGEIFLSFASYGTASNYGLTYAHAYSIEKIDTKNQLIYISNPWYSANAIAVPYSEFKKTAYNVNDTVYFSVGYLNS